MLPADCLPEELDAVHGEVLLVLVEDPDDDVVVVAAPLAQLGVEHADFTLRRPVVGKRHWRAT